METEYNGWTNKATWSIVLWIRNNESNYKMMIDSFTKQEWDASPSGVKRWADMIFGDETPDGDLLSDVDWKSVSDSIKEDTKEEAK